MADFIPTEEQEQQVVTQWLDWHKIDWWHTPNGGHRNVVVASKLKAQGVKRGVPDILIIDPPPACPDNVGTAIELKRVKGGRLSTEQKEWLVKFRDRGWAVAVCRGAGEAIEFLETLGYGKRAS